MKKVLFLLFSSLIILPLFSQTAAENTIASCCSSAEARCTGSVYCSACKNCSRCAHCNSGGSCGVCTVYKTTSRPGSSEKKSTATRQSDNSYSGKKKIYGATRIYYKNEVLLVSNSTLNLRKGPGIQYEIVEKLKQNDQLIFMKQSGSWLKIKVKKSKNEGWIYAQYVR